MSAMEYNSGFACTKTTLSPPRYFNYVVDSKRAPNPQKWLPESNDKVQIDAELRKFKLGERSNSETPRSMQVATISDTFREGVKYTPPQHKQIRGRHTSLGTSYNNKTKTVSDIFQEETKSAQEKAESALPSVSKNKALDLVRNGVSSSQVSSSSDEAVAPVLNYEPIVSNVRRLVFDETIQHPRIESDDSESPSIHRSRCKPRGLPYSLRRTDSGSTFQSLDGLSNSYPLIRKEAKKRKERNHEIEKNRNEHRQRSSRSTARHKSVAFDSSRFACFDASCFPMDDIFPAESLGRRGTSSSSRRKKSARDAAEKSKSTREELLMLRSQLRELRSKVCHNAGAPSIAETAEVSIVVVDVKNLQKSVRFATPLVTRIKYRPYTPQSEIAILYFQEEELEELEWDRETVCGEQFECQFDDSVMGVRIAYQKQSLSDE